jgi:hypothetical protein
MRVTRQRAAALCAQRASIMKPHPKRWPFGSLFFGG